MDSGIEMNRLAVVLGWATGFSAIAGCAGSWAPARPPAVFQPTGKNQWAAEDGAYHVELILGVPVNSSGWVSTHKEGELPPAPSTYRVTYHGPAGEQKIETESRYEKNGYAEEHLADSDHGERSLQVVVSDRGDALVIDEMIPNDRLATNNYTYVAADSQGRLTHTYFELPRTPTEEGKIELSDLPRITDIKDNVIRYRYHDGTIGSVKIANLKKVDSPVPPG
jgi:hypothetical protein